VAVLTTPGAAVLPDEKQQLESRIAALERQKSELMAKEANFVAAHKIKKSNTLAPRNETKTEVQQE
jgi:hypothetical protein